MARHRDGLAVPSLPIDGAAVAPDTAAIERLFRELYGPLCQVAYRITGGRDSAEDVVHDVFLGMWEQLDAGRTIDAPRPYLYRAVHNRAMNVVRAQRQARTMPIEAGQDVPEERSTRLPGSPVEDLTAAVNRAVAQLPERCRLVFTLSREHGLSYAEIASMLGISTSTVETQIARATARIRRSIDAHVS